MIKLLVAASISSFFFGLFGVDWEAVDEKIVREFPQVKMVFTDTLRSRFDESSSTLPLIIDVREADEFEVSHLGGAINIQSAEEISELVTRRGLNKDVEIIVYCSVGYRSAAVATDLQNLGYNQVLNLQHSLFEWANKRYPMVNDKGQTDKVHPFNRAWGELVEESLHAYPN